MTKLATSDGNGGLVFRKEVFMLISLILVLATALATTAMNYGRMDNRVDNLECIEAEKRLDDVEKNGAVYEQVLKDIKGDIKEIKDILTKGD